MWGSGICSAAPTRRAADCRTSLELQTGGGARGSSRTAAGSAARRGRPPRGDRRPVGMAPAQHSFEVVRQEAALAGRCALTRQACRESAQRRTVLGLTPSRSAACCTRSHWEVDVLVLIVDHIGNSERFLTSSAGRSPTAEGRRRPPTAAGRGGRARAGPRWHASGGPWLRGRVEGQHHHLSASALPRMPARRRPRGVGRGNQSTPPRVLTSVRRHPDPGGIGRQNRLVQRHVGCHLSGTDM